MECVILYRDDADNIVRGVTDADHPDRLVVYSSFDAAHLATRMVSECQRFPWMIVELMYL